MTRPTIPNPVFVTSLLNVRNDLCGCVSALCHDSAECPEADAFYRRLADAQGSVVGNRPGHAPVTWADLRLSLAASLRVLLAELEG